MNYQDTLSRRIEIVLYAQRKGIRAAVRRSHCSRNTVRYWLRQTEGGDWGHPMWRAYKSRLSMVNLAQQKGIRETARLLNRDRNTVRKWVR